MNLKENISLAIAGLRSNKMRAFLTMLGIIIGISSVIMITTLGMIMQKSVTDSYASLGANLVQIGLETKNDALRNYYMHEDMLTDEMIDQYKEEFGNKISRIGLNSSVDKKGSTRIGHKDYEIKGQGANADYIQMQSMNIIKGRSFTERDINSEKYVCLLSDKQAKKIYGNENPLGQIMAVRFGNSTYDFTIVGIYEQKMTALLSAVASIGASDWDPTLLIPVSTADRISGAIPGSYFYMMINGAEELDSTEFGEQTANFFNSHFYAKNDSFQCRYYTAEQEMSMMTSVLGIVQTVISVIAAISLLVGGIGVMNIMLVSVTERTREIGVRKALGAKNSAIRIQFITESMIICLIGGIIGIIFGVLFGNLAGLLMNTMASPSPMAIIGSVLFSMAIGVFFGYYPANKAAKMDPIEALRYE